MLLTFWRIFARGTKKKRKEGGKKKKRGEYDLLSSVIKQIVIFFSWWLNKKYKIFYNICSGVLLHRLYPKQRCACFEININLNYISKKSPWNKFLGFNFTISSQRAEEKKKKSITVLASSQGSTHWRQDLIFPHYFSIYVFAKVNLRSCSLHKTFIYMLCCFLPKLPVTFTGVREKMG